jgi:EAL domain-containing protein (putative c-di-GMP-specific phosphodiesterase class I)
MPGRVAVRDHRRALEVSAEIEHGLANGEFGIVCQPQVSLESGAIVAAEALARWTTADGVRLPAAFIPDAERSGLIVPLGGQIFELAARRAAVLSRLVPQRPFVMWVNLSARQVLESDVVGLVERTMRNTGAAPEHLGVEITETLLLIDELHARWVLHELRELGLGVALDDFGTGYSSMLYLKHFDFDVLKLAREFVHDLPTDHIDRTIVKAAVDVAHALGLQTVAEGIETETQLHAARDVGCDIGQGYLLGRPMTAAALKTALLSAAQVGARS